MFRELLHLFYPRVCAACGHSLFRHESSVCNNCFIELPRTDYHRSRGNPVEKIFWGRVPLLAAASFYLFSKGGRVQRLLHELKYKGKQDAGETVGRWYGKQLKQQAEFAGADVIIPVPLHAKRLRERGYNQSLSFAQGLSAELNIPVKEQLLKRRKYTSTQTKKGKFSRWENMSEIFECDPAFDFEGKHILLVDDVITTGSTLEACCHALAKKGNVKVSVATIAYAD